MSRKSLNLEPGAAAACTVSSRAFAAGEVAVYRAVTEATEPASVRRLVEELTGVLAAEESSAEQRFLALFLAKEVGRRTPADIYPLLPGGFLPQLNRALQPLRGRRHLREALRGPEEAAGALQLYQLATEVAEVWARGSGLPGLAQWARELESFPPPVAPALYYPVAIGELEQAHAQLLRALDGPLFTLPAYNELDALNRALLAALFAPGAQKEPVRAHYQTLLSFFERKYSELERGLNRGLEPAEVEKMLALCALLNKMQLLRRVFVVGEVAEMKEAVSEALGELQTHSFATPGEPAVEEERSGEAPRPSGGTAVRLNPSAHWLRENYPQLAESDSGAWPPAAPPQSEQPSAKDFNRQLKQRLQDLDSDISALKARASVTSPRRQRDDMLSKLKTHVGPDHLVAEMEAKDREYAQLQVRYNLLLRQMTEQMKSSLGFERARPAPHSSSFSATFRSSRGSCARSDANSSLASSLRR